MPTPSMTQTRSLKGLLATWQAAVAGKSLPQPPAYDGPDVRISLLTEKTSEVVPGACFVARVRATSDGHPYIGKAIAGGARLIVGQRPPSALAVAIPPDVVYLQVDDTALAVAWLAAAWEDFPSRQLVTIGITGTDGKTTTATILYEILHAAGLQVGLLSTVKAVIGGVEEPLELHVTTPEAPVVQHHLRRMVDAGLTHCVLEATSHGLAQYRVGGIEFDLGVVTNITHEHLDYHGSYEAYFAAKRSLFTRLNRPSLAIPTRNPYKQNVTRTAILNRDDDSYAGLAAAVDARQLSYGTGDSAHLRAMNIDQQPDEIHFDIVPAPALDTAPFSVSSRLPGAFNVYNNLAAAAAALALGVTPEAIRDGIGRVGAISGRMERVDEGQPFPVIVDFAHTPNALEKAIAAARKLTGGRVIAVFGSAGKRDVEKRRLMAEIAARHADLTVLTAEDPRTESLAEILEAMAAGCRAQGAVEGETFWRIADRGRAIYFAFTLARPEDLVLICGKGHEQSMCFGTREYPWDDREAARTALRAWLASDPMPDLGLPTYT